MAEGKMYSLPFGNKVPRSSLARARFTRDFCARAFGATDAPVSPGARAAGEAADDFGMLTIVNKNDPRFSDAEEIDGRGAVIIGTIRMGFGHWRMAIAMASAAHHLGLRPYLLDLMSFDGTAAQKTIKFLERWYNNFSRLSQKLGAFNSLVWEKATSRKDITSCVREKTLSELFVPIFQNLPKDIPLLSMHPWIGHAAVMAGIKNVVSIIPDNYPMSFWLVEGSRHTAQSPSAYMGYRTLLSMDKKYEITRCLPPDTIIEAGHYVDWEIVSSIEEDCGKRLERMEKNEPRRFLLTMGGAGAQAQRFAEIICDCKNYVANRQAAFLVNMGDHEGRWKELRKRLDAEGVEYTVHSDWKTTRAFVMAARDGAVEGTHVFIHDDFYSAVYLTNLLMRVCDIMVTKPSELSFYPIPKLFIQRVGRHEAWGAIRGSEIGDGTIETSGAFNLRRTLKALVERSDLLELYIRHIKMNNSAGVYNGARNAIEYALSDFGKISASGTAGGLS